MDDSFRGLHKRLQGLYLLVLILLKDNIFVELCYFCRLWGPRSCTVILVLMGDAINLHDIMATRWIIGLCFIYVFLVVNGLLYDISLTCFLFSMWQMSYSRSERYYCRSRSSSRSRSRSRSLSPDMDRRRRRSLSRSRSRSRSYDYEAENPGNNLYVTGLSTRVTKKELERHFASEGGMVEDCHLVVDPRTRESRGFAFVTMSTVEEADRCIKYLDRSVLGGRVITVEKAKRSRGRTPTPGRYLGVKTVRVRRRSPSYSPYDSEYSDERDRSYSPYDRRGRDRSYSPRGRERYRSRSRSRDGRSSYYYGSRYRSYSRSPCSRRRYRSYSRDRGSPYGRYDYRYRRSRSSYSPYYYDRRDRSYSPYSRRRRDSPYDRYDRSPSPYERRRRSVSRSASSRRSCGPRSPSRSVSHRSPSRSCSVSSRSRSPSASR
ncbi:serine/arginine-rich splicing factor SR45a isoform X1 [Nymphaea colorata]|nr:serine/arginine-rich splicing factor SR45a isoform X1 [Nymphaea colorata]